MTGQDAAPIRVLLVEDDPGDAGLAQIALRSFRNARFNTVWAQTLAEAVQQFRVAPCEIVLLDLTLPDSSGIDTVAQVRAAVGAVPIIVLTGQSDTEFGLNILKSGAADYLVKGDFGYDGLARTILYTLHRAKLEQELTEHRLHLEELVAQRTAELALAKDAAEAANRAKSVFLANMSHELRTPLTAILGFAQLMARDPALAESHRRWLETINRSGHHLLALINDVLEISRIEAGRTMVHNEDFDLTDSLTAIESMIRVRAEQKKLDFAIELQGGLPRYVHGDAHHLRQVLLNLLGNAVKYTEQGRITLRLTVLDGHVRFAVIDTGPGIASKDQSRIFQAFYQTEVGVAKGEGAGLGLTISREFVRLMGGEISVDSEPGKGSVFAFTLPLPEAQAPVAAAPCRRVIGLAEGQAPVRVLVAEDNADNRELIIALLGSAGLEVRGVANGQEAIECFEVWQPQFIWMDMRMPVLDGYQATAMIRSLPGGRDVKIAALTASAFREDQSAILAAGCDDMLAKPVDEARLFGVMREQLGVRFRCADDIGADLAMPGPTSGAPDLSGLSAELRAELANAAELLDVEAMQAIIARMRPEHPELTKIIAAWVDGYRFDAVAQLCGRKR